MSMWINTDLSGLWAFSPRQRIYTPIYTSTRDKKHNKLKQNICMSVGKTKRKRREERSMERWCRTSFPSVLTVNFRKCLWKSGGASLLLPMIWGLCLNPIFWQCQNHTVVRQWWRWFCFTSALVPEIYTVCSKIVFFVCMSYMETTEEIYFHRSWNICAVQLMQKHKPLFCLSPVSHMHGEISTQSHSRFSWTVKNADYFPEVWAVSYFCSLGKVLTKLVQFKFTQKAPISIMLF